MNKIILIVSFIIAIVGVACFKKQAMPFKLLCIYLVATFGFNLANNYVVNRYHNNAPILHITAIIDFLFFASIYYYLFVNKLTRNLILLFTAFVVIFSILNAIYLQPIRTIFPSNVMVVTEVLLVIFAILLFKQMLLYPIQLNIVKQGMFWYNTAILFFSAIMFLNYALINYLSTHHYNPVIFYFWDGAEIMLNLLLGVAVWVEKQRHLEIKTYQ